MRSTGPKSDPARVESLPSITRPSEVLVFGFEASKILVEGIVVGAVYVMCQLEWNSAR